MKSCDNLDFSHLVYFRRTGMGVSRLITIFQTCFWLVSGVGMASRIHCVLDLRCRRRVPRTLRIESPSTGAWCTGFNQQLPPALEAEVVEVQNYEASPF